MKTGAPRSVPGAPDPRRDVETVLARNFIVLPPEVHFDINEEFLSEEELSQPQTVPATDVAVEAGEQGPSGALPPIECVAEFEASAPSLSIAELLENSVAVDWHEAVAIAQRVCQALARDPAASAHQCLVDPRHVEITQRGDVRVLTGEPGSDPHVKQVGRILRALLEGGTAPVQLRLLASQAAFEVPVFISVDEFSDALRPFKHPGESDAIRMAFKRGLEAKFSTSVHQGRPQPALPATAIAAPAPAKSMSAEVIQTRVARPARPLGPPRATRLNRLSAAAALSLLLVGAITLFSVRLGTRDQSGIGDQGSGIRNDRTTDPESHVSSLPPPAEARSAPPQAGSGGVLPPSLAPVPAPAMPVLLSTPGPLSRPTQGGARRVLVEPERRPEAVSRETAPVSTPPAPGSLAVSRSTILNADSPDAAARQGAMLLASGKAEDAQRVFDSIVLANPLYQLDAARSTPEAVTALEASRRDILPALARRDYMNARAALDAGDYDRALSEGGRIATMLAEYDGGASTVGLRSVVQQLLARAAAVKAREDERIYAEADEGVTPPAPLSRQLPAALPPGITSQTVGTLEMLINREGEVETVKLHTPLNRYHERMIVSAAKAWRYRPASKDGRPVRFRLITTINLPER